MKLPIVKHILVFTTWGQKCPYSEPEEFTFDNFQSNHPVVQLKRARISSKKRKCTKKVWPSKIVIVLHSFLTSFYHLNNQPEKYTFL